MSTRIPAFLTQRLRQNVIKAHGDFNEVYQTLRMPKFSLISIFGNQSNFTTAILQRYPQPSLINYLPQ